MPKRKEITVTSKVIRHNPQFSRLVTIPLDKIEPWKLTGTTTVEGTINATDLGRRSLKRWDERRCWWIDLPEPLCKKAKLETGDEVFKRQATRIKQLTAADVSRKELLLYVYRQVFGQQSIS